MGHSLVGVAVAARHVALEVGDDPDLVKLFGVEKLCPGDELPGDRFAG
jgi:hypothetical protein